MAEAHTCTATAGHVVQPPCPGCQEHYRLIFTKEREVLDAVLAFIGTDSMPEYERLLVLGAEYSLLKRGSING